MKLPKRMLTARMVLRRLTPIDQRDFVGLLTDRAAVQFMFVDSQKTVSGAQRFLAEIIESYTTEAPYFVLAMSLADSGEFTGICGVSGIAVEDARELFCCVSPKLRRRGLATEALRRLIGHCSTKRGVREFRAYISPENHPSQALAAHLGMRFVGTAPHPNDGATSKLYSMVVASRDDE